MISLMIDTIGGANFEGYHLRNVSSLHVGGGALAAGVALQVTGDMLVSGGLTIGSLTVTTLTVSGNTTLSGNLIFTTAAGLIASNTSDTSDTKSVIVAGGGAASGDRGGYVAVFGNEHATNPGDVYLVAGTGGNLNLQGATEVTGSFSVSGASLLTGNVTFGGEISQISDIRRGVSNSLLNIEGGAGASATLSLYGATHATNPGDLVLTGPGGISLVGAVDASSSFTVAGSTTLNGSVQLGNAAADGVQIQGTIVTNLIFTDDSFDIGASGATRPRNLYLSQGASLGGSLSVGANVAVTGEVDAGSYEISGVAVINGSRALTNITTGSFSSNVTIGGTLGVTGAITGNLTGNASTATALQTARNINGVAFNGTANITVTAEASTLTGNTLNNGVVNSSLTSVGTLVNLTVTNTIVGSINGNAATATTLQTSRNINGVAFNGSADITVTAAAGTLSGGTLAAGVTVSSLTSVGATLSIGVTPAASGTIRIPSGGTLVARNAANTADVELIGHSAVSGFVTLYCEGQPLFIANAGTDDTVGIAGAASALPANPEEYWVVSLDGSNTRKIPLYLP